VKTRQTAASRLLVTGALGRRLVAEEPGFPQAFFSGNFHDATPGLVRPTSNKFTSPVALNPDELSSLIDTYAEPGGVRFDPSIGLLTFSAIELRRFARLLLADAALLDASDPNL